MGWGNKFPDLKNDPSYLEGRLSNAEMSLAQIMSQSIILDTDIDSTFKNGTPINDNYIRQQQTIQLGNFYQKLRDLKKTVQINARGDSLTYGFDMVSADKRAPYPTTFFNGTANGTTRASITYPEALNTALNEVYNNTVAVINQGLSGSTVKSGYEFWNFKSNSDLTVLCYGTNDSSNTNYAPYTGDIAQFVTAYRKMIIREILWGSALILMTPPSSQGNSDNKVDVYRTILFDLGRLYGIPVVDAQLLVKNYKGSVVHSDDTHYNGTGYKVIGTKLAAAIIGEGIQHTKYVKNGSKVLCRPGVDNVVYVNSSAVLYENATYGETPSENGSAYLGRLNTGGELVFSFYCDSDDLVLVPSNALWGAGSVTFDLDFGIQQPEPSLDSAMFQSKNTNIPLSSFTITSTGDKFNNLSAIQNLNDPNYIQITTEGWHTLRVKQNLGTSFLNGLDFIDYGLFYSNIGFTSFKTNSKPYKIVLGTAYNDTTDRPSTDVSIDDIAAKLNFDMPYGYWLGTMIKIQILSFDQAVMEYAFLIGDPGNGMGFKFFSTPLNQFNIATTPTDHRTLTNVTYSTTTRNLTFTWGNKTNRSSVVKISIL